MNAGGQIFSFQFSLIPFLFSINSVFFFPFYKSGSLKKIFTLLWEPIYDIISERLYMITLPLSIFLDLPLVIKKNIYILMEAPL